MNRKLLSDMLDFTQYIAACASTSSYEFDIIAEIRKLQPQIKAAIAAPTVSSSAAPSEPRTWLVTGPYQKDVFSLESTAIAWCEGLNKGFGEKAYTVTPLYEAVLATPAASPVELTDAARLDFVLDRQAFISTIPAGKSINMRECYQLMEQDEDEEFHAISGEGIAYGSKRDAIDAAMESLSGDTAAQGGE